MITLLKRYIPSASNEQCDQFNAYYQLLIDWNSRMNLTAITDPEEVVKKHFLDSLSAMPYIPTGATVADIGTGAGFPGIPLLIMRPDIQLTLVDALQKRVLFLKKVCEELNLKAECLHMRAEDFGRLPAFREHFDCCVSRAVSSLPVLLELTIPVLKVGGNSICYKGNPQAEIESSENALRCLSAGLKPVLLDSDYGARSLLICTKKAPTKKLYPRKAGILEKNPL